MDTHSAAYPLSSPLLVDSGTRARSEAQALLHANMWGTAAGASVEEGQQFASKGGQNEDETT